MIGKILCFLGFHSWCEIDDTSRTCRRCLKVKFHYYYGNRTDEWK